MNHKELIEWLNRLDRLSSILVNRIKEGQNVQPTRTSI